MIIFLVYGISNFVEDGFIYLTLFAIVLIIYLIYERKIDYQLFNLSLFKDANYIIGNFAFICCIFCNFQCNLCFDFAFTI